MLIFYGTNDSNIPSIDVKIPEDKKENILDEIIIEKNVD